MRLGTATKVRGLSYSAEAQLGRMEALVLDAAGPPLAVHAVCDSAPVEALRAMALEGPGVAWLPGSLTSTDVRTAPRDHVRMCRFGLTGGFRATNSRARMSVQGRSRTSGRNQRLTVVQLHRQFSGNEFRGLVDRTRP